MRDDRSPPRPELRHADHRPVAEAGDRPVGGARLRVLTYNVHRCRGTDRRLSPERIAEVIARAAPDVVALQELDVGRARSGRLDQPRIVADRLGMTCHFHSVAKRVAEPYGIAILTARPARLVRTGPLPALTLARHVEPRGAIWVALDLGGVEVHVVNTHMSLVGRERVRQAAALLGPEWLGGLDPEAPALLVGDLNSVPRSRAYRAISQRLDDAQRLWQGHRPRATFPAPLPALRLDHVFVNGARLRVRGVDVPRDALTRAASDHLPLVVDLEVVPAGSPGTGDAAEPAEAGRAPRRRSWRLGGRGTKAGG